MTDKMIERCFTNPYSDYSKDTFKLNDEEFKKKIEQLIAKYVRLIVKNTTYEGAKSKQRTDVYVGLSGIAFMFLRIAGSSVKDIDALSYAKHYIDAASSSNESMKPISLLSGDAGRNFVTTAVLKKSAKNYKHSLIESLKGIEIFDNPTYLTSGQSEMFVGQCGYLLGLLWLQGQLGEQIVTQEQLKDMGNVLMESGRNYSKKFNLGIQLMYQYHDKEYLGAAHGISAILFALLKQDLTEDDVNGVKKTIDQLLSLQNNHGNFPSKYNNRENVHLVHWCHGAPGMFYLMAKAYLKFGEQKYLTSCLKMGDLIWKHGLLKKGPGLCHGIGGNGYVHLLLYRITNDEKHLYRARKFAEFLEDENFIKHSRTPDRPYSLFEGLSGTVCYLIDLLEPEKSEFPFMDLFHD